MADTPPRSIFSVKPDDESLLALGRFMSAWSLLETVIQVMFVELSSIDLELGVNVFGALSMRDQVALLEKTAKFRKLPPDEMTLLSGYLSKTEGFSKKRNRIVHASWGRKKESSWCRVSNSISPLNADEWIKGANGNKKHASLVDRNTFDAKQMNALAVEIEELSNEVGRLIQKVRRSSRERSRYKLRVTFQT